MNPTMRMRPERPVQTLNSPNETVKISDPDAHIKKFGDHGCTRSMGNVKVWTAALLCKVICNRLNDH